MKVCLVVAGIVMAVSRAISEITPVVEIEEEVYSFTNARNGAGPMWCSGSTCLVRAGERLFASGLETVPGAEPLNNCRWMLFERRDNGWERVMVDEGRTREPAPMAVFADGRVFVSANPTLGKGPEPNGGPARPDVVEFRTDDPELVGRRLTPVWDGTPGFREHSYRSFAADGQAGELILFQNIGYTHAEWSFRDTEGKWRAQGQLKWPWGKEYAEPCPIRVCYPDVALRDRAVHFFGVSDIVEPNREWREFKRKLTGQQWDYDFRRLFYAWTPDITKQGFAEWVEIASREETCGWISPGDLHLGRDGEVHVVWSERALDERLRARFFPEEKQSHTLNYAVLKEGKVQLRRLLTESREGNPGMVGSAARFQATPEGRLFVIYYVSGRDRDGRRISENRVLEVFGDGTTGEPAKIPLNQPFTSYFTAGVRGGSPASRVVEMLGTRAGVPETISYARVRLY